MFVVCQASKKIRSEELLSEELKLKDKELRECMNRMDDNEKRHSEQLKTLLEQIESERQTTQQQHERFLRSTQEQHEVEKRNLLNASETAQRRLQDLLEVARVDVQTSRNELEDVKTKEHLLTQRLADATSALRKLEEKWDSLSATQEKEKQLQEDALEKREVALRLRTEELQKKYETEMKESKALVEVCVWHSKLVVALHALPDQTLTGARARQEAAFSAQLSELHMRYKSATKENDTKDASLRERDETIRKLQQKVCEYIEAGFVVSNSVRACNCYRRPVTLSVYRRLSNSSFRKRRIRSKLEMRSGRVS